MDPAAWQDVIDTNLTGTFNYSRAVMAHLLRRGGSVINVTSVSGVTGMAGQTNYSASKAGVIGFTKALAQRGGALRRAGQRHRARLHRNRHDRVDRRKSRKKLYAQIPMRQPGTALKWRGWLCIWPATMRLTSPDRCGRWTEG